MLRTLDISDMLIIDRLELEFQPGLNVLTGETGAGKSILMSLAGAGAPNWSGKGRPRAKLLPPSILARAIRLWRFWKRRVCLLRTS